jgi:putative Mg2+ transporter-C (MgtC) family protein
MLVCVGATMFMLVGVYGWSDYELGNDIGVVVDPSRVASYVVSGIGFLGAGAIIRHGINVRGLTTAASLWVVAAIGVSVGAGMYVLAIATTALVILALWPLAQVKQLLEGRSDESRRLAVTLETDASVASALTTIEESGFAMESVEVGEEEDSRRLDVVITTAAEASLGMLLDDLGALEGVRSATVSQ